MDFCVTHLRNCMRTLLIPPLVAVLLVLEPDGCVKTLRSSALRPVWLQREGQTLMPVAYLEWFGKLVSGEVPWTEVQ